MYHSLVSRKVFKYLTKYLIEIIIYKFEFEYNSMDI